MSTNLLSEQHKTKRLHLTDNLIKYISNQLILVTFDFINTKKHLFYEEIIIDCSGFRFIYY